MVFADLSEQWQYVATGAGSAAQDEIFADDFEWGSICAWSNDLWYLDLDGDRYGDWLDTGISSDCPPPAIRVSNNLDCDDTNPDVNPGADELCNGDDDDCDGFVDEDWPCSAVIDDCCPFFCDQTNDSDC